MSLQYSKRETFGFNCPSGGTWYTCSVSKFVGCCATDPCTGGCSQGSIRPASFDRSKYGKFPDGSCDQASNFYTCIGGPGATPFWGCCKSNPCGNSPPSCPAGDLVPAFIGRPEQIAIYSPTGGSSTSTAASSTGTTTIATPSTFSATVAAVSSTTTAPSQPHKKIPIAPIAGGAAAGVVSLLLIGLLIYYIFHTKRSRNEHRDQVERRLSDLPAMMKENPKQEVKHDSYPNSPPSYAFYTPPQDQRQPHYELPAETLDSPPPPSTGQKHRLSELSGETARRSELESPWQSPNLPNASSEDAIWSTATTPAGRQRQSDQALGITTEDGNGREHSEIRRYPGV